MRLDRLLFFLRLAKSRTRAQHWIAEGHMRCNGERVVRLDHAVAVGDVLTLPFPDAVRVIELLAFPSRRGPAPEARACYRALEAGLDADRAKRIAGETAPEAEGKAPQ